MALHEPEQRLSYWQSFKQGYESLVMTVIRPDRADYSIQELGPIEWPLQDWTVTRSDLQVKNNAGYTLECSWWKRKDISTGPVIITLHGNSSCRAGCMDMIQFALTAGFSVFSLDFCGSGHSEGKFVSLGYHESRDIDAATLFLRNSKAVTNIVLWGTSMGAVSALLCAERDPGISAMVLDVPFAKLSQLATELVDDGTLRVPKCAVNLVMACVRRSIKKRAKFDIYKLNPIDNIHKSSIPAFFGLAKHDDLIPPRHGEALYAKHGGPKEIFRFKGGHNSPRPYEFYHSALSFLLSMLNMPHVSLLSPKNSIRSQKIRSTREIRNPLEDGTSFTAIPVLSIKELKAAVRRAGYDPDSDVTLVEKKDLVDLVTKLYTRYSKSISKYTTSTQDNDQDKTKSEGTLVSNSTACTTEEYTQLEEIVIQGPSSV